MVLLYKKILMFTIKLPLNFDPFDEQTKRVTSYLFLTMQNIRKYIAKSYIFVIFPLFILNRDIF